MCIKKEENNNNIVRVSDGGGTTTPLQVTTRSRDSARAMCYVAVYTGKMLAWLDI